MSEHRPVSNELIGDPTTKSAPTLRISAEGDEKERRRYALLQSASILQAAHVQRTGSYADPKNCVKAARELLSEIEKQEQP